MHSDLNKRGAIPVTQAGTRRVDTSPPISDEVKFTTCYMCACRCGIKVHLKDGKVRYIQGNREHPVNQGVLCAKGSAGIMQHYSPARLTKPLKRVGERGAGEFQEIEWDEALSLAADWLGKIRKEDPRKLAFFTGRDQSQALTGWWATQFGTPNYAAHGGFCSVNMAAGGLYSIGGSFWEFGEPDWEHTEYFMMFGIAEDHDSNPIKLGLSRVKARGAKFVSVNPVRTGYSAIADEWLGITPGSDGLFVLSLVHELLKAGKVDLDYLVRYTNAPWLVIQNPGEADDGLIARDEDGNPLCWDAKEETAKNALLAEITPALKGQVTLPDGRAALPVFHVLAERYLDGAYAPDAAAQQTGIAAATIRRIAAELAEAAFEKEVVIETPWTDWAGRRHERMIGRPVSMHAMRGISAHSNGFHTCRALHLLQVLLGSIDCPGGFRYKPPFPKPIPPAPKPSGKADQVKPESPMPGPPLGFPMEPADLLIEPDGSPRRIDKGFSWDAPLSAHGMMHMVIRNAWAGDPYKIDTLFMYMANMAWNSSMNTAETIDMLTDKDPETGGYKIPHFIYADAYFSETVPYADLVLPDTTYLERWDCISLLDRPICDADGAADSIRYPVVEPDRDVRPFQDVMIDLGGRLGLPGLTMDDGSPRYPGGYSDYLANHERGPGIGSLAGWRGENGDRFGRGEPNPDQLLKYIENQSFWRHELDKNQRYFKHANRDYLDFAHHMGFIPNADPIILQLYSEPLQKFRLAAQGHGEVQPPEEKRERIAATFDPLPIWYPPFEDDFNDESDFPLHAITQRPMAMYHSWGSQNAWLRQIHGYNRLYLPRELAESLGVEDDDFVWVISRHSRIKVQARKMEGVNGKTIWTWNAIGKRSGAWNLDRDAPESAKGFLLNHLIDELLPEQPNGYRYSCSDPVTGQAAWYDLRVRVEKADPFEAREIEPKFPALKAPPGSFVAPRELRYGAKFKAKTGDGR
ncbi:MAG: molybdopterin oxidoreductase family protein [Pseudomonadota bacterium]